ncbi:hypothetical protein F511_03024 [Dorcoceras hygrometricum]|nr:hypothetical protein F511_03024 [Dorcoceras hygrometricum]
MASKKLSLLLLFSILLYSYPQTQARDSQSFSKVSAAAADPNQEPPVSNNQQQEPNFVRPENDNGYGLYGHDAGQLPPSAAGSELPHHRHLPKNYNTVAYVTEPEEYADDSIPYTENSYTKNLQNNYGDDRTRYNNKQEDEQMSEPEQYRYNNNYQYYGGSSFNSGPQGLSDTRSSGRDAGHDSREKYFYNGGEQSRFRPQGMSDTRSLENGKYFYDINTEKYSSNHPYEALNKAGAKSHYNDRSNYYGANEYSMGETYQNQYEFQDDASMP